MSVFLVILGVMVLGDLAWGVAAVRRLPRRWMRVVAGLFATAQLLSLASIIVSRGNFFPIEQWFPRWWQSAIFAWHLLLVVPWLLWQAIRGVVLLLVKAGEYLSRRPATRKAAPLTEGALSRRQFIGVAAAFTPPLLSFGAAAVGEGQLDEFRVRKMDLDVPGLPPEFDGLTIAHVTDTHVGRFTRGPVLERIVEETNRMNADIVALTGDLINDSLRAMPAAIDLMQGLRARHMVVTCEGNHDLIENPQRFYREAHRAGLPLLRGETASVTIRGRKLQVLAMPWAHHDDEMQRDAESLLAKRDESAWPLILAHHPHAWDHLRGLPLTLSGHTHGGQLMLNEHAGAGPIIFRYWSGLYRRPGERLLVSNGTGNWFPVRIQAPAEIIQITLRPALA